MSTQHPPQETASSSTSSDSPFSHQPFSSQPFSSQPFASSHDEDEPPFYSPYPEASSSTSQYQYDTQDPPQTSSGRPTTSSGLRPGTANPFRQQAYQDAYGFDARPPTSGGMDWDPYANTRPRTSRSRGGAQLQQQQQGMGVGGGGMGVGQHYIEEEDEYGYVDEDGEEESEDEGLFAFLPPNTAEQEADREREMHAQGVGGGQPQPQTPDFAYSMGEREPPQPPRLDQQESYVTARSGLSEQPPHPASQQPAAPQPQRYEPPISPPSTESNSNEGSRGGVPREGEFRMMRLDAGRKSGESRRASGSRERKSGEGRRSEDKENAREDYGVAKEDGEGAENRTKEVDEDEGGDAKKKEDGEEDEEDPDAAIPKHYAHFQPNPARSNANSGPYKRHREYHHNQANPQYSTVAVATGIDTTASAANGLSALNALSNGHSHSNGSGLPLPPGTGTASGGKPSTRGSYGYAGDYADRERWERRKSKQRRGGTGTTTAAGESEGYGGGSEGYGRGRPGTGVSEVDGYREGGDGASVGSLRKGSWGYESREWDEDGYEGESREGSIKMEFDFDAIEDEDSPYPEVRASVSNIDDPDMPAMTVRMWVVGLLLCMTSSAFNVFFNFRQPAPSIVPLVLLLLSYPVGKFLAFTLPITTYRIPLPCIPSRWLPSNLPRTVMRALRPMTFPHAIEFSLNPGPWNIKEHVLVYIMANVAVGNPYALNAIVVLEVYYEFKTGYWFSLVLVLATQLTGFGLAGMCRRFLVWPASMVWPQNLVACTLLNTLHAEDEDDGIGMLGGPHVDPAAAGGEGGMMPLKRGMSRYKFFIYTTLGSFFFFFLPGYLFEALSVFSFVCWAVPDNIKVNQLFGVKTGLGMSVLTFDWTQISWIGSPLMVPWWAEVHIFAGFVIFYWVMTPILYYTNAWQLAYFPISANQPFDRFGNSYNIARVLKADGTFDEEMYDRYSPLFLPATYAVTYLLAFCLSTCVIVHTVLYHGQTLLNGFKKMRVENDDIHAKLMRNYPEVPDWWYASAFCAFFALAIVAVEVWDTGVPVWALLLSVLLPVIYILPSGFIYAMTGQGINLNILAQIIPGSLLAGQPLANMVFKAYSVQTLAEATSFVQDLKLGHYVKVPPRATFLVQLVATTLAAFIQVGVKQWIFDNVEDICSDTQKSNLTCPHNQVFYTASAVWGLIGPTRQFGDGSIYHYHLYAIVIGVFLPIPFWLWRRRYPNSWVKWVSTPVVLNGVSWIPPATGINYSSWFMVGVVFQYVVRKRNFAWWSKFNYVLSSALDSGTVIAVIVIFFTLQFPKYRSGTDEYGVELKWWGNLVHRQTADYQSRPLLTIPAEGIPIPSRS